MGHSARYEQRCETQGGAPTDGPGYRGEGETRGRRLWGVRWEQTAGETRAGSPRSTEPFGALLSRDEGNVLRCAVQYGSHSPCVATERSKCGEVAPVACGHSLDRAGWSLGKVTLWYAE